MDKIKEDVEYVISTFKPSELRHHSYGYEDDEDEYLSNLK